MAQINPEIFTKAASMLLDGQAFLPSRAIGKAMLALYPGKGATDKFSDLHTAHIAFLKSSLGLGEGGLLEWEGQHTVQEAAAALNAVGNQG